MTRKKIALLSLGGGLVLGLILLAALGGGNSLERWVKADPLGALEDSVHRVAQPQNPANVGFLGEIVAGETAQNCSGSVTLQAQADGLRVYVFDCTLGDETGAATFSLYADPTQAAVSAPEKLGEGWYGVDLTQPLAQQAQGTAYDTIYSHQERAQAQQAADGLRAALEAVTGLDLAREWTALLDYLKETQGTGEATEAGYQLHFTGTDPAATARLAEAWGLEPELLGDTLTLDFGLTPRGGLNEVSVTGTGLTLDLQLGDAPERELTPRLEAQWTGADARSWAVTLALTVADGSELEAPAYESAFVLLDES